MENKNNANSSDRFDQMIIDAANKAQWFGLILVGAIIAFSVWAMYTYIPCSACNPPH